MSSYHKTNDRLVLKLDNGVEIEMIVEDDNYIQGIGKVSIAGGLQRSDAVPMRPLLKTISGAHYTRFQLENIESLPDGGLAIHTLALGEPTFESALGDWYCERLVTTVQNERAIKDKLTWIFRPEKLQLHELEYSGFSYAWKFSSDEERVFRIISRGTWEIGGCAEGNTILSQGQITPPIYEAKTETRFTSACLNRLDEPDNPLGVSFQLNARWGCHQCFDFLASPPGTLLGYWPGACDVRSFLQKNPGEDVIFVVDAMDIQATHEIETERKCILFAPAGEEGIPEHVARNRWKDAFDFCTETVRSHFGIKRTRPLPETYIDRPSKLRDDGVFLLQVEDEWVPSQEWLYAVADKWLPDLASRGIRRVIPTPTSQSDPSERGYLHKLQHAGIQGSIMVGSCCCVHRYLPSEFFGGFAAWRYFADKAHSLGMEVGQWIGPHLAYEAPIFEEHPEWACYGPYNMKYSGGYPSVLATLNWNTPAREWVLNDLKRWKDEGGLDYVWFDSLANLGMAPVDYARDMQPNSVALAEFVAGLQRIGIGSIAIEGVSPLGVAAPGVWDPNQGPMKDLSGGIAGQNTWEWYWENEDMYCDHTPRIDWHPARSEDEARRTLFRCLANRCVPAFASSYSLAFKLNPPWLKEYHDLFVQVEPHMVRRHLLPDKRGVLWTGGAAQLLFAFEDFEWEVPRDARITRADGGAPVLHNGKLMAQGWTVYRF